MTVSAETSLERISKIVAGESVSTENGIISAVVTEEPDHHDLTHLTGTKNSSGDNTILSASLQTIVIANFVVQNESATATTINLKSGTNSIYRAYCKNQGDGLSLVFAPGREWRIPPGNSFLMNLSGANVCGYSVAYWLE